MEKDWYYLDSSGSHRGPASGASLTALSQAGSITADTLLWADGESNWMPLAQIAALQSVAAAAPADQSTADELAAFTAEMRTAGAYDDAAGGRGVKRAAAVMAESERPSTPDEKSFVDDDGTMYVWDAAKRAFAVQATGVATYDESVMTFDQEEEIIPTISKDGKVIEPKRAKPPVDEQKLEAAMQREKEKVAAAKEEKEKKEATWFDLKQNTSVYVTGLPEDVSVEEIEELFSKCGIIKQDAQGKPRIKIYRDKATGAVKGDGLVTYLRVPSVDLAVNILHGTAFRPGQAQMMSITAAKFEQKGDAYVARASNKQSKKKRLEKQEKNLGWGGYDDMVKREQLTVVLKHMFTQEEFQEAGVGFISELEADIAEECGKLGPLVRLKVFPHHPEGVCSVQFKTPEAAAQCIGLMHGRWFGGNQVHAALWDGVTNYHVQKKETEAEQALRLERYAAELENSNSNTAS